MGVEERELRVVYRCQGRQKRTEMERIGEVVEQVIEREVLPRQARFERLAEVWGGLLPEELQRHCRIADVSWGLVRVLADSPSYVYELQLCREELLEGLQQQCPRLRIRKLKFAVG
jgi:hypothetical protein